MLYLVARKVTATL